MIINQGLTFGPGIKIELPIPANTGSIYGMFAYGFNITPTALNSVNLISNTGTVASDSTGAGTARWLLAGAMYGSGSGIFAYGRTDAIGSAAYKSMKNLVSNTGTVAADVTGVGTARYGLGASGYGNDKAIFAFGNASGAAYSSAVNLVSNTGVVVADGTPVGTGRWGVSASGYSTDKAIFGFGYTSSGVSQIFNLVSNLGVIVTDTSFTSITSRYVGAATRFGGDKGIFGYGYSNTYLATSNIISNTGSVAADVSCLGTARSDTSATTYGTDKGVFGYGSIASNPFKSSEINLVSNTGVIASASQYLAVIKNWTAGCGYGAV